MNNPMELEDRYLANFYNKRPAVIVRGRGAKVWDIEGKEYIDCLAGHGVAILGHSHPRVVEAVKRQVETLITCPGTLYNPVRAELGEKLCTLAPKGLDKVFLSNSGTEAVECAIKLAWKYTGKREIIALKKGFHGRTLGSLSATWKPSYRAPFEPLLQGFTHVNPRIEDVEKALTDDTAAVIIEPIQGEGGVILPPEGFIEGVRELCDRRGILLIGDEVQTGLGRTGKLFAFQHFHVTPDILCLAKGLGGGVPIGATLARAEIMDSMAKGEHGSTFGGNPLACAAALAVLEVLEEEKLPERAERLGRYFLEALEELKERYRMIRDARGLGLMLALEFRFSIKDILLEATKRGLLTLPSGLNILRFLPPLIIDEEEIDKAVSILDGVCKDFER